MNPMISTIHDLIGQPGAGKLPLADDLGAAAWRDAEAVNVREYRILGDGSDETAKIQLLLDNVASDSIKKRRIFFPNPTGVEYKITAPIRPQVGQLRIQGEQRDKTVIKQYTANTPIFLWDDEGGGDRYGITVSSLQLIHANNPTTLTTQQYGIQFRQSPDGTGGLQYGYHRMRFEDIRLNRCYVGIGQYTASGYCPIWGSVFRDLEFYATLHHAIKLYASTASGQPANLIENINVLNYDGVVVNDSSAIRVTSATGLVLLNVNIEDWQNRLIHIEGGTSCVIVGLRTERHTFTENTGPRAVYFANGQLSVKGAYFQSIRTNHTSGVASLFYLDASAKATLFGVAADRDAANSTGSGTVAVLSGDPTTCTAEVAAIQVGTGISDYLSSGFGTGLYVKTRQDGLAPKVDVLPSGAAIYRGREFRVEGGAGVADVTSRCEKDAANAHVWTVI